MEQITKQKERVKPSGWFSKPKRTFDEAEFQLLCMLGFNAEFLISGDGEQLAKMPRKESLLRRCFVILKKTLNDEGLTLPMRKRRYAVHLLAHYFYHRLQDNIQSGAENVSWELYKIVEKTNIAQEDRDIRHTIYQLLNDPSPPRIYQELIEVFSHIKEKKTSRVKQWVVQVSLIVTMLALAGTIVVLLPKHTAPLETSSANIEQSQITKLHNLVLQVAQKENITVQSVWDNMLMFLNVDLPSMIGKRKYLEADAYLRLRLTH